MASGREAIYAELGAPRCRHLVGPRVQRRAGSIGDAGHHVEVGADRYCVDQYVSARRLNHSLSGSIQFTRPTTPYGINEADQDRSVADPPVTVADARHAVEGDFPVVLFTAQTEQQCVAGRSVEALVQLRGTSGHQLDLDPLQREPVGDHVAEHGLAL